MRRLPPILLFAVVAACNLDTERAEEEPRPPDAVDVTMQFCDEPPLLFAYKNEGYAWVVREAGFNGLLQVTFPARAKVTVVTAIGSTGSAFAFSRVRVRNLTAAEADAFRCRLTPMGVSRMTGLVQTEETDDATLVQLGDAFDFTFGNQAFVMQNLGAATLDLVAINRYGSTDTTSKSRVIVRSNITVANNAAISSLNFTGAESKPLDEVHVHHDAGPLTFGFAQFETLRKSRVPLSVSPQSVGDSVSVLVIPASFIKSGDLHRIDIQGPELGVTYWQSVPKDTTVTMGPALSTVTVDTITGPTLQPRVRFASQSQYPAMAEVVFQQTSNTTLRSVEIITTAGFLGGTPAQWELSIPDLRGIVYDQWIMQPGLALSIRTTARDARPALYHGVEVPAAGETMRFARKFGS